MIIVSAQTTSTARRKETTYSKSTKRLRCMPV